MLFGTGYLEPSCTALVKTTGNPPSEVLVVAVPNSVIFIGAFNVPSVKSVQLFAMDTSSIRAYGFVEWNNLSLGPIVSSPKNARHVPLKPAAEALV